MEFGEELAKIAHLWKKKNHMKFGFDRTKKCQDPPSGGGGGNGGNGGTGGGNGNGNSGGKGKKCCNRRLKYTLYNPEKLQCCTDGNLQQIGTC